MAGKKATTPVQEVQEPEVKTTTPVKAEPKQVKVYEFKAENPYLTVTHLGIQFREGKASTTNLEIAKALAKVGGVELVEE